MTRGGLRDPISFCPIITRQALAGTRFTQPSLRHLVIEAVEVEHRGVDGVASARRDNRHDVPAASAAVVLHHSGPGFNLEMRFASFLPLMIFHCSLW